MDESKRDEIARRRMAEKVTERVWQVPSYEGAGPVTMTLRVPEVTITDSAGRFIVLSPRQTGVVSARLDSICDWLQHGGDIDDDDYPGG